MDAVIGSRIDFPKNLSLRQVFWFVPIHANTADYVHTFWLENAAGQVYVVRTRGIGQANPESVASYFSEIDESTSDSQLRDQLLNAWIFPPQLDVKILRDVLVNPAAVVSDEHPECEADLISAAQDFFNKLNQTTIKTLDRDVSVTGYNTVIAWPQQVFRNRLQACEKYPWIKGCLGFSTDKSALPQLEKEALSSIDSGQPFEMLLAEQYGVDRHTLRCVAKISSSLSIEEVLPILLPVVFAMRPDFRLRIVKTWRDLLPILRWFQRWNLESDMDFLRHFAKDIFSDGVAGARRVFRRELLGHNPEDPSFDLEDYLQSLQLEQIQQNSTNSAEFGQIFQARVRACGSVFAVFAESVAWHQSQSALAAQAELNLRWPPLLSDEKINFLQFSVRELTNGSDLFEDGVAQKNCVASYTNKCAEGKNFIFSLMHNKGRHARTTAHYLLTLNGLRLMEHRAYDNATPCAEAQADVEDLSIFLQSTWQNK